MPLGCPFLPDQEREGRLPSSPLHTFVLFALTSLTVWNYSLSYSCLPYRPVSHWKPRNPPGAGAGAQAEFLLVSCATAAPGTQVPVASGPAKLVEMTEIVWTAGFLPTHTHTHLVGPAYFQALLSRSLHTLSPAHPWVCPSPSAPGGQCRRSPQLPLHPSRPPLRGWAWHLPSWPLCLPSQHSFILRPCPAPGSPAHTGCGHWWRERRGMSLRPQVNHCSSGAPFLLL